MDVGRLYCIVGKSGTGKDTLFNSLLALPELGLTPLIPYTTRPIRANERDGVQYHFVSESTLHAMEAQDAVIEKRAYKTVHGIWYYFTARTILKPDVRHLLITTPGALPALVTAFGGERVTVAALWADDKELLLRSIRRENLEPSPNYAELCRRFLADARDFEKFDPRVYPHFFLIDANAPIENSIDSFKSLILQEEQKSSAGHAPLCPDAFFRKPEPQLVALCESYLAKKLDSADFYKILLSQ